MRQWGSSFLNPQNKKWKQWAMLIPYAPWIQQPQNLIISFNYLQLYMTALVCTLYHNFVGTYVGHSLSACLPACLSVCLPACLPANLPVRVHTCASDCTCSVQLIRINLLVLRLSAFHLSLSTFLRLSLIFHNAHVRTHTYTHTYTYTYTYIYAYTYTYIHTYTYLHTY